MVEAWSRGVYRCINRDNMLKFDPFDEASSITIRYTCKPQTDTQEPPSYKITDVNGFKTPQAYGEHLAVPFFNLPKILGRAMPWQSNCRVLPMPGPGNGG